MALESKNRRRKRLRRLEALGQRASSMALELRNLRVNLGSWVRRNRDTEKQLLELSKQYLKVCEELNKLRPEESRLIVPVGNWRVPS